MIFMNIPQKRIKISIKLKIKLIKTYKGNSKPSLILYYLKR